MNTTTKQSQIKQTKGLTVKTSVRVGPGTPTSGGDDDGTWGTNHNETLL